MAKDIEFKFNDMDIEKLIKLKKTNPEKYKKVMQEYENFIGDMLGCFSNALSGIKTIKTKEVKTMGKGRPKGIKNKPKVAPVEGKK